MEQPCEVAIHGFKSKSRVCPQRTPKTNVFWHMCQAVCIRCTAAMSIQLREELVECTKHFFSNRYLGFRKVLSEKDVECCHKKSSMVKIQGWKRVKKERKSVKEDLCAEFGSFPVLQVTNNASCRTSEIVRWALLHESVIDYTDLPTNRVCHAVIL